MKNSGLKSCPFCNGKAEWGGKRPLRYIYCTKCRCRTIYTDAVGNLWHRRVEIDADYEDVSLKPCPICGKGAYIRHNYRGDYSVVCECCKLSGSPQESPEKAREAWNCRN